MTKTTVHKIVTYSIATVWITNGFFCKVLDLVPRHKEIVGRILHLDRPSANVFTIAIGFTEIVMAVWILSGFKTKWNAIAQIVVVAIMNTLEFVLVPDLLLWGKLNSLFAFIFILVVYFNEFYFNKKQLK